MVSQGTILAIDLGTSSVKAMIVGPAGDILAQGRAGYPTVRAHPDHDEQRLGDWLAGMARAVASARQHVRDTEIDLIAVTGQMHGTILYGRDDIPLHPAIIWSDRRSASMLPAIDAALGSSTPSVIGGPMATGYQATTLAWFERHRPDLWANIHRVALPVDAIVHALCGQFATDPSNAVGSGLLNAQTGFWDATITATLGIPMEWLPTVVPTGSIVGQLTERGADILGLSPGTPIGLGGGDAPAAAIGAGALTSQTGLILLSTGAQVIRPIPSWNPEPRGIWHTWPSPMFKNQEIGPWLQVGALLNGGRAIDWIHHMVAPTIAPEEMLASCESVHAGAEGLLFIPYLAGKRTPVSDAYARGAFIGLADRHLPVHLVRAVAEGICLAIADVAYRMVGKFPLPERIVFAGGTSRALPGILASLLDVPLVVSSMQSLSAFGAASIVAEKSGWRSIVDLTPMGTTIQPQSHDHAMYQQLLDDYRDIVLSLLPMMHRLQGIA